MAIEIGKPIPNDAKELIKIFLTGSERMQIVRSCGIVESTGSKALSGERAISEKTYEMVLKVYEKAKSVRKNGLRKTKHIA